MRGLLAHTGKQAATKATRIYDRIAYVDGKLAEAPTPEGRAPSEVGDRVAFKAAHRQVSRVTATDYGPTNKVTFLADGRKPGRRVEARLRRRVEGSRAPAKSEAAPKKDKAMLDAFNAAISAVIKESAA